MNDTIVVGQQQQSNGSWVDVKIPKIKHPHEDIFIPMAVERWGQELRDRKLTGTYRAFTIAGNVFTLYVLAIEEIVVEVEKVE